MAAADESGSTKISIQVQNSSGEQITFKVKKKTAVGKIMDAYCKQAGLDRGACRFTFDGQELNNETTPIKSYGMEEGSVIEMFQQQ